VVRGGLDQVARIVPGGVHGLAERHGAIRRRRPCLKRKSSADDAFALEEVDEVVDPVHEQGLDAIGLARKLVAFALLDGIQSAHELEEGYTGGCEQLRAVRSSDDEADVGLVLEGLPAQE
jgi:hypothetical protein